MGRSSSASTTQQSTQNVQDIDTQQVSSEGGGTSIAASGGSNITLTDAGAVDSAFDFADAFGARALDTVGRTTQSTLDFAGDFGSDAIEANREITQNAISHLGAAITKAGDVTRSDSSIALQRIALYAAVAAAVIFVAMSLRRK
jgi:hypothetical protein